MLDNVDNCNNITKIVKVILCDCDLYDWYLNIIYKNYYYTKFLEQYEVCSNDILKDYLIYCFKNDYAYMVSKRQINVVNEAVFGNIFMLNGTIDSNEDLKSKQRLLHEHKLREHLHYLIYLAFNENREKTNMEVLL